MEDKKIKSGKEILDEFFNEIEELENVDKVMAKFLKEMYFSGEKVNSKKILSKLEELRESENG
ncbi:hypothetical protein KAU33_17005 [Candidatus Dependentiae bacterium]|nr:hypothetical protein [Candidatus Dependentiae bacterium]